MNLQVKTMQKPYSYQYLNYNAMTLMGQDYVTVTPDSAIIRLGVETNGETLTTIQNENAQISQAILGALKALGVSDIKTYDYSINKRYDYENGMQIDRGYVVRNILEITLENTADVGLIIDTAVNNGANVVDFISFEVTDNKAYYRQALNLAVIDAIEKSKSLSVLLGLPMDPFPVHITENSTAPVPYSQINLGREKSFATPIEPGNKKIEASVTVEFYYQNPF
jgi:uncharacterized protein